MQIGDWGNVLIHHVCEWKHRKYSLWACPFSGVEFCGAFHFQKIIFLQLFQIWSSYCFDCDTDQLWMHTQSNNKTKCLNGFYWQSKIWPPICALFGTKSTVKKGLCTLQHPSVVEISACMWDQLLYLVLICFCCVLMKYVLPWYNPLDWLGVKNQLSVCYLIWFFFIFFLNEQYNDEQLCTHWCMSFFLLSVSSFVYWRHIFSLKG